MNVELFTGVVRLGASNVAEPIDELSITETAPMAWRLYFSLGDVLACMTVGAVSGWLASLVVSGDWFTLVAMATGMIVGMLVGLLGSVPFTPLFGSFEIMLPASLSGMLAGMAIAMADTAVGLNSWQAATGGAMVGLVCLIATYVLDARLRGVAA